MSKVTREKRRRREDRKDRRERALGEGKTAQEVIALLRSLRTQTLPSGLRHRALELGRDLIPDLIAIVENEPVEREDDPEDLAAWPAAHAADLLTELHAPEAIGPILDALVRSARFIGVFHDRLLQYTPRFGAALSEPGMAMIVTMEQGSEGHGVLCHVLVCAGVRDHRLLANLWEHVKDEPEFYVDDLVTYDDASLLPELLAEIRKRLSDPVPKVKHPHKELGGEVFPLADAYRALGGALPEDVEKQCMDLDARIEVEMESILGPHVLEAYKRSLSLT